MDGQVKKRDIELVVKGFRLNKYVDSNESFCQYGSGLPLKVFGSGLPLVAGLYIELE